MRRRRKYLDQRQSDNHERWLVSYADFITLLFAFFVVMYALSTVSEGKYRVLSDSLNGAFRSMGIERSSVPITPTLSTNTPPRPIIRSSQGLQKQREQMREIAEDVLQALGPLVRDGQVKVTQSSRGISIEINASVLFASGQAQLRSDSGQALQQISKILAKTEQGIQVAGYTDDTPINTSQFPSNWELSAARASSVVRLFIENGVTEERLSVIGYGPNHSIAANDTAEGRALNRRVTIMILAETPGGRVVDIPLSMPQQTQ